MGLFGNGESDVEQVTGGFLKRLRGARTSSFVEPGLSANVKGDEPRFKATPKAINPSVSFLGRKLSGDDIEDVEAYTETAAEAPSTNERPPMPPKSESPPDAMRSNPKPETPSDSIAGAGT